MRSNKQHGPEPNLASDNSSLVVEQICAQCKHLHGCFFPQCENSCQTRLTAMPAFSPNTTKMTQHLAQIDLRQAGFQQWLHNFQRVDKSETVTRRHCCVDLVDRGFPPCRDLCNKMKSKNVFDSLSLATQRSKPMWRERMLLKTDV